MNRDSLKQFSGDEKLFAAHIFDLFRAVADGKGTRFTDFCDIRKRQIIRQIGRGFPGLRTAFFGGYDECERTLCAIYEQDIPVTDSPISAILITAYGDISHRDILGAVLALGLKRENIGDIVRTQQGHVLFAKPPADKFIINELDRAGREAVKCMRIDLAQMPQIIREYKQIRSTVSSLRLDSVVSVCIGVSREKGRQLVEQGRVSVDAVCRTSPSYMLDNHCVLSIRGFGKYIFSFDGAMTAKGRYGIIIKKIIS